MPAPDPTVRGLIERQAHRHGPQTAVTFADGSLTYSDVLDVATRAGHVLVGHGVRPGDTVGVMAGNQVATLAGLLGCTMIGAVFMPVNPLLRHDSLGTVLAHARVGVLVVDRELVGAVDEIRTTVPTLDTVLVARGSGVPSFEALLDAAPSTPHAPLPYEPTARAKLMYTSGTTGTPKGVVWDRACEYTWATAYADEMVPVAPGETVYCCLPLSHVTAQGTLLATFGHGGHTVMDPGFDAFAFWRRVRSVDAVLFSYVGTILSVLGRRRPRPDDADNPVRRVLGAAAPGEMWRPLEERFGFEIVDVWGQTETAGCWTKPASLPQEPGTVGREVDRFEARLVSIDDGTDVEPGTPGELWIRPTRSGVLFSGYLAPDGTIDRSCFDDDGWYRTGDLLHRTDGGDLVFRGRIREAIRRRGEMIPAGVVEDAARSYPGVDDAAAVGVTADDGVEEEIKLCVVPDDGTTIDVVDLHGHLRATLPRFMVPRYIDVRSSLPKTPSTRVRKFALIDEGAGSAWDSRGRAR